MFKSLTLGLALFGSFASAQPVEPITPVPFTAVRIEDAFWTPRLDTNREVTVWYDFKQCEETGRIHNFEVAGGLVEGEFEGIFYNDSDVYKVIEGAAYSLATSPDPKLDAYLDGLIAKIAAAQEPDGYLYTQRTIQGGAITAQNAGRTRWSYLAHSHELYNAGHLYEAAVAHFQATGKRTLLEIAIKNADLVCGVFGPGEGQRRDVPGHEEIEIGLVKLAGVTGERKYLDLARFFIDMRGRSDLREVYGEYAQDHIPVVEQTEPVGHAVRAGYLYAGMADVAAATGAPGYTEALDRIWEHLVSRRMYLTGGIGAHRHTEGFGADYDLPNADAYNETCAAVASMLWSHRMFLLHGDSKYMDIFERTLYNAFLPGVSMSGDRFFYPNPLAADGVTAFNHGSVQRAPWFGTSCCPVNVVRVLPSLPGYVYAVRGDDIYVNLFVGGEAEVRTDQGVVRITQETGYPWDGHVRLTVRPERASRFALRVRWPGWARGRPVPSDLYAYTDGAPSGIDVLSPRTPELQVDPAGYLVFEREWQAGDTVEFTLPMPVRFVRANGAVTQDLGRVALERGPLVYCFEGVDNIADLDNLVVEPGADAAFSFHPDLLGGVGVIDIDAAVVRKTEGEAGTSKFIQARAGPLLRLGAPRGRADGGVGGRVAGHRPRRAQADAREHRGGQRVALLAGRFARGGERSPRAGVVGGRVDPASDLVGPPRHGGVGGAVVGRGAGGVGGAGVLLRRYGQGPVPRAGVVAGGVPGWGRVEARGGGRGVCGAQGRVLGGAVQPGEDGLGAGGGGAAGGVLGGDPGDGGGVVGGQRDSETARQRDSEAARQGGREAARQRVEASRCSQSLTSGVEWSLGFVPVLADGGVGDEGDIEGHRLLHAVDDEVADLLGAVLGALEDEFVVDLQEHADAVDLGGLAGAEVRGVGAQAPVEVDHRDLDEVGGGALDDAVDGGALGEGAAVGVVRGDVRDLAAALEHRLDIAVALGLGDALFEEGRDAGEALLVAVDDLRGLGVGDAEAPSEAEGGDAVDDAEVDHLRAAALVLGDLLERDAMDLGGDGGVDVLPFEEGLDERGVARQMGEDAELDLGVVGGDEDMAGVGDEGLADVAADLGADGDVLEVGVAGAEAPGGGDGLVEAAWTRRSGGSMLLERRPGRC